MFHENSSRFFISFIRLLFRAAEIVLAINEMENLVIVTGTSTSIPQIVGFIMKRAVLTANILLNADLAMTIAEVRALTAL
ncbi:uncharacterized protein EAF02_010720 [Botrytis sinoallii]|uniref:uncharacterized protein n=1 Tax=Botrytis sinoallii TaxID=1463999 RepID=UPI001900D9D1|nr:uncharacterized protein EAF02_010720 [Botrytis sinoallii]KAF7861766.1 hypothetical protein EAF02_010720 [Botrytis sinoallii]